MSFATGSFPSQMSHVRQIVHVLLVLAAFLPLRVQAQEATAGLSSPAIQVGQTAELVVTVRDAKSADVPPRLDVPGLEIDLFGRSSRFEMNNFQVTSSLTLTYRILARKPGEFDIPPIPVQVGKKSLSTNPLRLQVLPASAPLPGLPQAPQGPPKPAPSSDAQLFFGDLVLSKKKAYVGEVIPAEFRYYFRADVGGEVGDRPTLSGEGFTMQKPSQAPKREQIVNGENYVVFSFQTALTAAKSGRLEIPAATLEARLQLPGSVPSGFEEMFRQFGGMVPPGMFTDSRQVAVETRPASLEILSLPKEGRPQEFSGAIGQFEMEATASPLKAAPGEPITLRVTVTGQGNLDAMGPPRLIGAEGWKSYPPSESVTVNDAIRFSGRKIYEFPLVARESQSLTPPVEFSYFDPNTSTYRTLTQAPIAVEAQGGESRSPAAPAQASAGPSPSATPAPSVADTTILPPAGHRSWRPLLFHPLFLGIQAALGLAALVALGLVGWRLRSGLPGVRRKAAAQVISKSLAGLSTVSNEDFCEAAVKHLANAWNVQPIDLAARLQSAPLDDSDRSALCELIARSEESRYAPRGVRPLDQRLRDRIQTALSRLRP